MTKEITLPTDITPVDMVDVVAKIVASHTIADAWSALTDAMAHYGFDRLFYGYTRFNTKNSIGDRDDLLLLSSMPEAYIQKYIANDMYTDAPMTRWARENVGAMSWSWIGKNRDKLDAKQVKVLEFNQSFGLLAGYTIAFKDAQTRHKGAIALAARSGLTQDEVDHVWATYGKEINALNQVAHLKFSSLPVPRKVSKLSDRQREVLEWVGDGKTMQDIATILDLTRATVEKHLKNARDALGVETTAQAVHKAAILNQIFVVET